MGFPIFARPHSGQPPVEMTYITRGAFNNAADTNPHTATVNIGTAFPGRLIVIGIISTRYPASTITIGGVNSPFVQRVFFDANGAMNQVFAYRQMDTGTFTSINVNWSGSDRAAYIVYALKNVINPAPTIHRSSTSGASGANRSMSINVPEGGLAIAAAGGHQDSGNPNWPSTFSTDRHTSFEKWRADWAERTPQAYSSPFSGTITASAARSASIFVWR